jgi:hypothetical protein
MAAAAAAAASKVHRCNAVSCNKPACFWAPASQAESGLPDGTLVPFCRDCRHSVDGAKFAMPERIVVQPDEFDKARYPQLTSEIADAPPSSDTLYKFGEKKWSSYTVFMLAAPEFMEDEDCIKAPYSPKFATVGDRTYLTQQKGKFQGPTGIFELVRRPGIKPPISDAVEDEIADAPAKETPKVGASYFAVWLLRLANLSRWGKIAHDYKAEVSMQSRQLGQGELEVAVHEKWKAIDLNDTTYGRISLDCYVDGIVPKVTAIPHFLSPQNYITDENMDFSGGTDGKPLKTTGKKHEEMVEMMRERPTMRFWNLLSTNYAQFLSAAMKLTAAVIVCDIKDHGQREETAKEATDLLGRPLFSPSDVLKMVGDDPTCRVVRHRIVYTFHYLARVAFDAGMNEDGPHDRSVRHIFRLLEATTSLNFWSVRGNFVVKKRKFLDAPTIRDLDEFPSLLRDSVSLAKVMEKKKRKTSEQDQATMKLLETLKSLGVAMDADPSGDSDEEAFETKLQRK